MIKVIIFAMEKNRGIGLNSSVSGLPWQIKSEMDFFKNTTKGNGVDGKYALVMGRKTYEKILCLKNKVKSIDNLDDFSSLKMDGRNVFLLSSIAYKNHNSVTNINEISGYDIVFICGGLGVYEHSIKEGLADFMLISKIKEEYKSDVFMPDVEQGLKELFTIDKGEFIVHGYQINEKANLDILKKILF